jgi:hypothetical protein
MRGRTRRAERCDGRTAFVCSLRPCSRASRRCPNASVRAWGSATSRAAASTRTRSRIPDSPVAHRATDLARSLCQPWLFNHCLRTYIWGAMLAQAGQIHYDEELFFVASALHDLGLTGAHKGMDAQCACFAVEGARAAHRFAAGCGWAGERCDRVSAAISLHLNVRVGLHHGAEAHLLHEGAALDVIGTRARELGSTALGSVLNDYPRLEFTDGMVAEMKEQARTRPRSRAAWLVRIGFIRLIRAAGNRADGR